MILFILAVLASFLLGTLLTLSDFFPAINVLSITYYLMYQRWNIFKYKIEQDVFLYILLCSLILFLIVWFLPFLFKQSQRKLVKRSLIFVLFLCAFLKLETSFHFTEIVKISMSPGNLYEKYYKTASYTAPNKKRNLIVLFLESMENTYQSEEKFGRNLIPSLSEIDGLKFSNYTEIQQTNNTHLSLIGSFCGLSYIPLNTGNLIGTDFFVFSKNICLPDILEKEGYKMFFYTADFKEFSNKDVFLKAHHIQEIEDSQSMYRTEDDLGFVDLRGIKDSVVLNEALKKIRLLGKEKTPFAFFISTLNTHEFEGFLEPSCEVKSDIAFKDIISCADQQIKTFMEELKKEPFFENTTVVIAGDHLARKNTLYSIFKNDKNRLIYNSFINTNLSVANLKRTFTAFDLGPTILETLGFKLKDGALGLGRSLLSDEPTLIEKLGKDELEKELLKKSKKYNTFLKE